MQTASLTVSVVIPTRNRIQSLERCLNAIASQTYPLREVIVVDASDEPIELTALQKVWPSLHFTCHQSPPSVCKQRNAGIRLATGSHILLCDDDIVLPPEYVEVLVQYLLGHPEAGAATGSLHEFVKGTYVDYAMSAGSAAGLFWRFMFQLSVWGDVEETVHGSIWRPFLTPVLEFYRGRRNSLSLAGWPTVTHPHSDAYSVARFGLGASIVRRDWLLLSPYDEILDPHGIGDHYGVATGFPGTLPITVVAGTYAIHQRSETNRQAQALTYYKRILALHYFMTQSEQYQSFNRLMLLWSLVGNFISHLLAIRRHHVYATAKSFLVILTGRNPYLVARRAGLSGPIEPSL
jgi:glycosyltransferase involved in cell wall biosynthesis